MAKNNFSINLIQSWRESFALLLPKNLSQFLLLTLKTYSKMWQSLFSSGGILYVMIPVGLIMIFGPFALIFYARPAFWKRFKPTPADWASYYREVKILNFIMLIPYFLLLFVILCAVRPTEHIKNSDYYFVLIKKYFFYSLFYLALAYYFICLVWSSEYSNMLIIIFFALSTVLIVATNFLLDSSKHFFNIFTCLLKALKMLFYTAPIIAVCFLLFWGISKLFFLLFLRYFLARSVFISYWVFTLLLFMPFYICLLTNLYSIMQRNGIKES